MLSRPEGWQQCYRIAVRARLLFAAKRSWHLSSSFRDFFLAHLKQGMLKYYLEANKNAHVGVI